MLMSLFHLILLAAPILSQKSLVQAQTTAALLSSAGPPRVTLGVNNPNDLLLVANSQLNNVIGYNIQDEIFFEFIPASVGLKQPQHIVMLLPPGHESEDAADFKNKQNAGDAAQGYVYVSHGDTIENSAIAKFELDGRLVDLNFISNKKIKGDDKDSSFLHEPHGFTFSENYSILYVTSSRTNTILVYNAVTGEYIGVLLSNDGILLEGPSHIAIHENDMYITTKGLYGSFDGDSSHIYKFNMKPGPEVVEQLELWIEQPTILDDGIGYVSLSDISIQCSSGISLNDNGEESSNCIAYVTDFGGGLRAYDLPSKELIYAIQTSTELSETNPGATGSIAINRNTGIVYTPLATTSLDGGAILQYNMTNGMAPSVLLGDSESGEINSQVMTVFKANDIDSGVSLIQSSNVLVQNSNWLRGRPNGIFFVERVDIPTTPPSGEIGENEGDSKKSLSKSTAACSCSAMITAASVLCILLMC